MFFDYFDFSNLISLSGIEIAMIYLEFLVLFRVFYHRTNQSEHELELGNSDWACRSNFLIKGLVQKVNFLLILSHVIFGCCILDFWTTWKYFGFCYMNWKCIDM